MQIIPFTLLKHTSDCLSLNEAHDQSTLHLHSELSKHIQLNQMKYSFKANNYNETRILVVLFSLVES